MIKGIGTDIIDINRVAEAVQRNPRFLSRNFTAMELDLFEKRKGSHSTVATNYAIKEATSKALGTGFRGFNLIDIEVLRDDYGKPVVNLLRGARDRAIEIQGTTIHVTSSHDKGLVVAYCVIEGA